MVVELKEYTDIIASKAKEATQKIRGLRTDIKNKVLKELKRYYIK